MKKLIAILLVVLSLLFVKSPFSLSNVSANYHGTYTFYSMQNLDDERVDVTKSGGGYLICCSNKVASEIYSKLNLNMLQGESFSFLGEMGDVNKILSKLNVSKLKEEKVGDIYIVYGYSPNIKKSIDVDDQKINIQIALSDKKITVGTPLILGGY